MSYSWLVACALLQADTDVRGRTCAPHYIHPKHWDQYQGDHFPIPDNYDCRLINLRPLQKDVHQGRERQEWQIKTMPQHRRGTKRPHSQVAAARAKAEAKAKAKPKAKARTRAWQ